ncbi:MAG: hypothetical protein BMS9Abin13_345 [Patescibacteria group bacterium]|nr:MAG: hypothetical protein BMS9Abin13_345 [Patescibacteria group bacterium]
MPEKDDKQKNSSVVPRSPIIVIMGHIDHGKSALLDYIRKSNIVGGESGGITQHLSAYEVEHITESGTSQQITFLDTPGHEAFSRMRSRGATVADIAILVVSAEDGVKQQTKEAFASIKKAGIPFIVAINKIDKPAADVERTKQDLSENKIYLEGYGGDIPYIPISAKTGEGVSELLDMMLLVAEMEGLTGDPRAEVEGIVIESHMDAKRGIAATLIIKNGVLKRGVCVVAEESFSPVRIFENFLGKAIGEASFSSPVRVFGWNNTPKVGSTFTSCATKKEAERHTKKYLEGRTSKKVAPIAMEIKEEAVVIPLVIKTDVLGTLEAIEKETEKLRHDSIQLKIIHKGVGNISENDIKLASGTLNPIVLGFNVKIDKSALDIAGKFGITIKTFDVIYKLTEWLTEEWKKRIPKVTVEEVTGKAKIIKVFSRTKNKQVVGGKVAEGTLQRKANVKITRRGNEIGMGGILELQQQKIKTDKVEEGNEFGAMIESRVEISPGDMIEAIITVVR